ncbi:MAG: histidine kinase [Acidobacteria bacterium]|nr:histidine kinase [Acidobacteriota bacterium]
MRFSPRTRLGLLILLGWAGATLFFTVLRTSEVFRGQRSFGFVLLSNGIHYACWVLVLPLVSLTVRRFPFPHGFRVFHGMVYLATAAGLAVVVSLGYLTALYGVYFQTAGHPAISSYRILLETAWMRFFQIDLLFGIILLMAFQGWQSWREFQAEKLHAGALERELAVSHLEALRMQLHPHFLFNTLHTIASLISEQPTTARRMVVALGDFLRLTLKSGAPSVRSLAEELDFADLYLGIEKLRLGDRLILNYDMEPEATAAEVPFLLLQPLFENAVRHGAARMSGPCEISFRAYRENQSLIIVLENDGPKDQSGAPAGHGVGLENTRARLHLLYGDDFKFEYARRPEGGVRIEMSLPYCQASSAEEVYAGDATTH